MILEQKFVKLKLMIYMIISNYLCTTENCNNDCRNSISYENNNREFETVDLDNSPTNSTRPVTHTIEIQMQEQEPPTHNNENTFEVENVNEHDSITKF